MIDALHQLSDKLVLEVGRTYLTANRYVVKILTMVINAPQNAKIYVGDNNRWYLSDGTAPMGTITSDAVPFDPIVSRYVDTRLLTSTENSLEVGKTYFDVSSIPVKIVKLLTFSWESDSSVGTGSVSLFYLGDNDKLYTAIGQGVPDHSIDKSFEITEDLLINQDLSLVPSVAEQRPTVGYHISELKRILSHDELDVSVNIT